MWCWWVHWSLLVLSAEAESSPDQVAWCLWYVKEDDFLVWEQKLFLASVCYDGILLASAAWSSGISQGEQGPSWPCRQKGFLDKATCRISLWRCPGCKVSLDEVGESLAWRRKRALFLVAYYQWCYLPDPLCWGCQAFLILLAGLPFNPKKEGTYLTSVAGPGCFHLLSWEW
jgi:hypothetical protein